MEEESGKNLNENINPTQEDQEMNYDESLKEAKEKFFERYNAYKRGLLSVKELTDDEVILAQIMLREEFGKAEEKTNDLVMKNGTMQEEIRELKKQADSQDSE